MFEEINAQIDPLCSLTFRREELDYLRSIRFIKNDYVEFLRLWRPIREYVETGLSDSTYTEIKTKENLEGREVVLGVMAAPTMPASGGQSSNPFMPKRPQRTSRRTGVQRPPR